MLLSHLALPQEGHLTKILHIFGYLDKHHNATMVFDPTEWDVLLGEFEKEDWDYYIYGCEGFTEEIPPNAPKPIGKSIRLHVYVNSDHADDTVTHCSQSGFIVYLNNAPIYWFSKRQTLCETSAYRSEFIAMKQACEYVCGLQYKLQMIGIPDDEPTFVYGDNQSVLASIGNPGATLKKKISAIAFYFVRGGFCPRRVARIVHKCTQKYS